MNLTLGMDYRWHVDALSGVCEVTATTLETLALSTVPAGFVAITSARTSWLRRLLLVGWLALGLVVSDVVGIERSVPLRSVALAHLYYSVAALGAYWLMPWVSKGIVGRAFTMVAAATGFILLPTLALERIAGLEMLVFGWNAMLAAYSYCVDARRFSPNTRASDCLFFVLVDPSLVFPSRAQAGEVALGSCMSRIACGAATAVGAGIALQLLAGGPSQERGAAATLAHWFALMVCAVLALYALRAGVAEVRVGLLGLLGFRVSACFNRPYLARSPADFWRRWNLWVGNWARRYVFWPVSAQLARGISMRHPRLVQGGALLATFAFLGLLHDALVMLGERRLYVSFTCAFACAGVLVIAWEAIADRTRPRSDAGLITNVVRRAAMLAYLFIFLRVAGYV